MQDIKWLGVRPSDLDRFNIPKACRIKMTDEDLKTGKKMVRSCSATLLLCPCNGGRLASGLAVSGVVRGELVGELGP